MNKDFKERLSKLREKPDASKTILQAIYLEFSEPIGQLETFLTGVVGVSMELFLRSNRSV